MGGEAIAIIMLTLLVVALVVTCFRLQRRVELLRDMVRDLERKAYISLIDEKSKREQSEKKFDELVKALKDRTQQTATIPVIEKNKPEHNVIRAKSPAQVRQLTESAFGPMPTIGGEIEHQ